MKNKIAIFVTSLAVVGLIFAGNMAFADATTALRNNGRVGEMRPAGLGVFGTVSSVNGSTIIVLQRNPKDNTMTAYTVDASNATIMKNGASSSVSNISVGDTAMVQGTVSGTSVTATIIRDGVLMQGREQERWQKPDKNIKSIIQGNGQPVIGGSVTAISSSTLTITNKSSITYTVDTSNATIMKDGVASNIGNISVGDNVVIQGTVNGTSINASLVIDQGNGPANANATSTNPTSRGIMGGFFNSVGGFFRHLFGFF